MRCRLASASAAAALVVGSLVLLPPAPSYAVTDGDDDCAGIRDETTESVQPPKDPSAPLEELQVDRAQAAARRLGGAEAGAGVRVAVIDSGVYNPDISVYGAYATPPALSADPTARTDNHGTAVAGIIAGAPTSDGRAVGIAPGAEIYDVRVYDVRDADAASDGQKSPTADSLIAGLEAVAPLAGDGPGDIRIVNMSIAVKQDDPRLEAAVAKVTGKGAIVVASSGNRDDTDYEYGEDAADTYFPAGYAKDDANPLVVAAGTTTADVEDPSSPPGLLSSAIDVVVPTYGALSYGYNDSTCAYFASSTSVAAAEVTGILAMLMSAYPGDTARELIARLETTATGGSDDPVRPDKSIGHGIAQPVDALTRPLPPNPEGASLEGTATEQRAVPVDLPRSEPDLLRSTRRNAVWWGLLGGGALVVALLLRPVLSRRRAAPPDDRFGR